MTPLTPVLAHLAPVGRPTLPRDLPRAVRGALGAAFMHAVCERDRPPSCVGCDLVDRCRISTWYDPGRAGLQRIRPFALREVRAVPGPRGAPPVVTIDSTWLGPVPGLLVVDALREVARRLGPGDQDTWTLATVLVRGGAGVEAVVDAGRVRADWPPPTALEALSAAPAQVQGATIHLDRRVQLDKEHSRPTLSGVLRACLLRLRSVQRALDLPPEPRWPDIPELPHTAELSYQRAARDSRHPGQHVDLSGWTGTIQAGPALAPWADLLALGEQLQVGRHTSEGLGVLRISWA